MLPGFTPGQQVQGLGPTHRPLSSSLFCGLYLGSYKGTTLEPMGRVYQDCSSELDDVGSDALVLVAANCSSVLSKATEGKPSKII